MHSLIDIIGGLSVGLAILAFWLAVHDYVDRFIVSEQNGMDISVLILPYVLNELISGEFDFGIWNAKFSPR